MDKGHEAKEEEAMRFKKYHPNFIELDEAEESEYRKWHEVTCLEDCMKVL